MTPDLTDEHREILGLRLMTADLHARIAELEDDLKEAQAKADDWQAMKDERDAAKYGYACLLDEHRIIEADLAKAREDRNFITAERDALWERADKTWKHCEKLMADLLWVDDLLRTAKVPFDNPETGEPLTQCKRLTALMEDRDELRERCSKYIEDRLSLLEVIGDLDDDIAKRLLDVFAPSGRQVLAQDGEKG